MVMGNLPNTVIRVMVSVNPDCHFLKDCETNNQLETFTRNVKKFLSSSKINDSLAPRNDVKAGKGYPKLEVADGLKRKSTAEIFKQNWRSWTSLIITSRNESNIRKGCVQYGSSPRQDRPLPPKYKRPNLWIVRISLRRREKRGTNVSFRTMMSSWKHILMQLKERWVENDSW